MRKKAICTAVIAALLIFVLSVLAENPVISCKTDLPEGYLEAIESQARGVYAKALPLVPVYVSVDRFSADKVNYTIYYFPFGTVGMSYTEGDGYNIEKPLTNL